MDDGAMLPKMPGDLRAPPSDGAIFDRIVAAVLEQKLASGAKLPEAALCDAYDCSRSQIRRVLVVLAERGVVTLHANRGAFVPSRAQRRPVMCSGRDGRSSGPLSFRPARGFLVEIPPNGQIESPATNVPL
jgi:Bacterial regulatory proteins, gntR family